MVSTKKSTSVDDIELQNVRGKDNRTCSAEPSNGCYVTRIKGVLLVCVFVGVAALVGVVVHYAAPKAVVECICGYPDQSRDTWLQCQQHVSDRNMCLSNTNCVEDYAILTTQAPHIEHISFRLPLKVNPLHYNLELTPDIYCDDPMKFTLIGHVSIIIKCAVATDVITLHINKLEIDGDIRLFADSPSARVPKVTGWEKDSIGQFLKVHLDGELTFEETYIIEIYFHGPIKDDLTGLYWSSYSSGGETRYIATTQMQPTDARKTFPCFDEPGVKATYDVTLLRKSNMTSLANMNLIKTEMRDDGWEADVYNTTLKMSTYLLAFIISDFENSEGYTTSGTRVRVWSRPDAIHQTRYALDVGIATINYFETYFGITFPLPKQDMVAVPDFLIGAMENWGLIIYREAGILYEPELSSATDQQWLVELIVHELAHQWFGNLVTPAWWDDLWLNEGFASYMEYKGMNHLNPDWKMSEQFVVRDLHESFLIDSLSTSHPIYVPVQHPDEINEIFDKISYLKGASIIRMMNYFLGEQTFTAGLTSYLRTYAYNNTHHSNLWQHLTMQEPNSSYSVDVSMIMNTWVRQMGYPVVTMEVRGDAVHVTQKRFLSNHNHITSDGTTSPYSYKWNIPVTYIQETSPTSTWNSPHIKWMTVNQSAMHIGGLDVTSKWLIGNVGQYGYYRVNYNHGNWDALIQQLKDDHSKISIVNRAQIIDDAINLGRSGDLDPLVGLRATEYLDQEQDYVPWMSALDGLSYMDNMLKFTKYYGAFQSYMLNKLSGIFDSLGFDYNRTTELHLERYKRILIAQESCYYGHQACQDQALDIFRQWMTNPETHALKADLRSTVYCNAIRNGGATEWDFLYQYYKYTNLAAEAASILKALACSRQSWILNRYMEYSLDGDVIRRQDGLKVIMEVSRNPIGSPLAWNFYRENWSTIRDTWGGGFGIVSKLVGLMTATFNTEFKLKEVLDFKAEYPDMGTGTRAFDQVIESTRQNVKWMNANMETIGEWLMSRDK